MTDKDTLRQRIEREMRPHVHRFLVGDMEKKCVEPETAIAVCEKLLIEERQAEQMAIDAAVLAERERCVAAFKEMIDRLPLKPDQKADAIRNPQQKGEHE
jgi:hypothetical protein